MRPNIHRQKTKVHFLQDFPVWKHGWSETKTLSLSFCHSSCDNCHHESVFIVSPPPVPLRGLRSGETCLKRTMLLRWTAVMQYLHWGLQLWSIPVWDQASLFCLTLQDTLQPPQRQSHISCTDRPVLVCCVHRFKVCFGLLLEGTV